MLFKVIAHGGTRTRRNNRIINKQACKLVVVFNVLYHASSLMCSVGNIVLNFSVL